MSNVFGNNQMATQSPPPPHTHPLPFVKLRCQNWVGTPLATVNHLVDLADMVSKRHIHGD